MAEVSEVTPWLIGVDVGQVHDPSAMVIASIARQYRGRERWLHYECRYIERFPLGLAYPAMVQAVARYIRQLPLPRDRREPLYDPNTGLAIWRPDYWRLIVDATGVGRPIVDLFRLEQLHPIAVTVTHGDRVTEERWDEVRVPKRLLIGAFQVVMQTERFKVAQALPHARTLIQEAQNFQYKITPTGTDTYGAWREGTHDDVLFAGALTAWYGERQWPPQYRSGQGRPQKASYSGLKWR
jgi:hypothetical protein